MARVVPPLAIPAAVPDGTISAGAASPREGISGDVTYRLGGQFWPSRATAKLHGDLLLIQRRHRQEAAVQLSGASVELQGSCSIKIEAPGTPLLVMRLDNSADTDRWLQELQATTQRSMSYREMLKDVPLLMLSPRSEVSPSPTAAATAELEALRSRLSQEEATTREMEMSMKSAEIRADSAQQSLREIREKARGMEQAMQEEQAKRKAAETQIKELQAKLGCNDQSTQQALRDERSKLEEAEKQIEDLQSKVTSATLQGKALEEEQKKRRQAENTIQELQSKLDTGSSQEKAALLEEQTRREKAESQIQELQNQLASAVSEKKEAVLERDKCNEELQLKLEQQSLEGEMKREQAEAKIKELLEQIEDQFSNAKELQDRLLLNENGSAAQEMEAAQELQLLRRRLASAEQRLLGEEQWRKVAEESKAGAEKRLADMEELLAKNLKKLSEVQRAQGGGLPPNADDEETIKKLENELKQLQNVQTSKKAAEEKAKALQARVHLLETQLSDLATESKAQMFELHNQWLSKEQAAKTAADAQLEALQTQLAELGSSEERKQLQGALESQRAANEATVQKLQDSAKRIKDLEMQLAETQSSPGSKLQDENLELKAQVDKLEGAAGDLQRRLSASEQRLLAEQHRRETAEGRTQHVEGRLADLEEERSMTQLKGQLEAAKVKASREEQAKTVAQRQLVAALKAATAAGAKLKAAETWTENPQLPCQLLTEPITQ